MMRTFGFLLAATLATSALAEVKRGIEYARPNDAPLLLDASTPEGAGPFPVVVHVHGGGWMSGDRKSDINPFGPALEKAGIAWVSIDYRLAPASRWPAPIEDVRAALRYVRDHAKVLNVDADRIAVMGYSAGGQLALLAATDPQPGDPPIRAAVGLAPPTDFEQDLAARGGLSTSLQNLLDRPKEVDDASLAMLRKMGPIHYVKPGLPPFLIMQGDADKTVPPPQAVAFKAKCDSVGVPCDLILIPGAEHRIREWRHGDPKYLDKLTAWLGEKLDATPTTTQPTTKPANDNRESNAPKVTAP
jgi:acetyl esterase/lipase